jgi:hypothetical protein
LFNSPRKSLPTLTARLAMRGRDYERGIPEEYLMNLNRYYDDWMVNYSMGKKLIIESDKLDFLNVPEDFDDVCRRIMNALDQPDLFMGGVEGGTTIAYPKAAWQSLGQDKAQAELEMQATLSAHH